MTLQLSVWDLALIAVVSLQVTTVAYIHAPRWKALILFLPFPFTMIALGLGNPIDVNNVLAMVAILLYVHGIRWLNTGFGVPVVPAIALSLVLYCLFSWSILAVVPATQEAFWIAAAMVFLLALALHLRLRSRIEPAHRTPLPVWQKLPIVIAVVCLLLVIKESLQGFATLFPMVTVVGAYEARHSLWTLGRQIPVFIMTMTPMMILIRLTQDHIGLGGAIVLGWLAFLLFLVPLTRHLWAAPLQHGEGTPPEQEAVAAREPSMMGQSSD